MYSKRIKELSFTLHYYSPKAYRYLRTLFSLPSPRMIRKWLENVECKPGFLIDVMATMQTREKCLACSLVIDSMSLRRRLIMDHLAGTIHGYVDIGGEQVVDEKKEAKEALVFLLVPLTSRTRYPVGFFFVDKIDAALQSTLIRQCLQLCAEQHIQVVNITCDGCHANISTLKRLGASIPDAPYFKHPTTQKD